MRRHFPSAQHIPSRRPTGRKRPPRGSDPKIILDHIAEVSKNARATWFGLLGLLAFVGVTLLAHNDADFFAYGAETQLPLIGLKVPVKAFFVFAPLLVAALYAYLHLYLMTLWDALASAPAKIDGQPLSDRVFPWLISYAAVWDRNRRRKDGSAAPRAMGRVITAVSFALGSLFGVAVLALLWWRSMPAHDEWLTLWIGLCLWFAALIGMTGILVAGDRMAGKPREKVVRPRWGYRLIGGVALVFLACLSWLRTEGGFENYAGWIEHNGAWIGAPEAAKWLNANLPTTKAIADRTDLHWFNLSRADLSEAELTRKPSGWLPFDIWLDEFELKYQTRKDIADGTDLRTDRTFFAEATRRYNAPLSALGLKDTDLRNADMTIAFLPGADLRFARMQRAHLRVAKMQGADLSFAEMEGANLRNAEMQGANLSSAKMQDADCDRIILRGALLQSATLTCNNLTQDQLEQAVGDSKTVLPDGLTVASCLKTLPKDVEEALVHHPEQGNDFRLSRAEIRDALLCDPGEEPVRISGATSDQP